MGFDHVKLEKGMYRESGKSFTQVLEQLDPSESYKGTALEGTDAFQRQLKLFLQRRPNSKSAFHVVAAAADNGIFFEHNRLQTVINGSGSSGHASRSSPNNDDIGIHYVICSKRTARKT